MHMPSCCQGRSGSQGSPDHFHHGHTSNTRETITKDRAHVHFELNLFVNDRFFEVDKKNNPGERNDHGIWNGQNLDGIDPQLVLVSEEHQQGANFSLVQFIKSEDEALPGVCAVSTSSPG